jgi:hypothetical protein
LFVHGANIEKRFGSENLKKDEIVLFLEAIAVVLGKLINIKTLKHEEYPTISNAVYQR